MYLFNEFRKCIQTRELRHYFIPSFNLLEIKLTQDARIEILQILDDVIQSDMMVLGQCHSLAGVWSTFQTHFDNVGRNTYFGDFLKIRKRSAIARNELLIDSLHKEESFLQNVTREQLLTVLFGLISELNTDSSLSLLTKKRVFQLETIYSLFCFPQGNKSQYTQIRALDRNVFGNDIANSKLWLATFLCHRADYIGSLQKLNELMLSIPSYAFYWDGRFKENSAFDSQYRNQWCHLDVKTISRKAWLLDIDIMGKYYSYFPQAIRIELHHCCPGLGISVSPFIYAYYLMFVCFNELGEYDKRHKTLYQLMNIANHKECCSRRLAHAEYNILGHCLLVSGYKEIARATFMKSARISHQTPASFLDKYNSAYHYLQYM